MNGSFVFCWQVLVTIEDGNENYDFVWVDELGITSAYAPKTTEGDHQTIVFVSFLKNWLL